MSTTTYFNYTTSFDIDKLFDQCRLKSLYSTSVPNPQTQESVHAMTANERDFFDITLKESASKVYDLLAQDTKIVENPIEYDANNRIYFRLMIHGDWDRNQSFGLNTLIEKALVSHVLTEWYKVRSLPQFQIEKANFDECSLAIRNNLNRRIRPVEKTYRYLG